MTHPLARLWHGLKARTNHLLSTELDKLSPQLERLVEQRGPQMAHVGHRLIRVGLQVGFNRLAIRLAKRHPGVAIAVALVGGEIIDEFTLRHVGRLADWAVDRFVRLSTIMSGEYDVSFLEEAGIDPRPHERPQAA